MKRFEKRDGWFSKDKLEVIDNLVIKVKNGVYSGHLERLDIKGIRVDKEIYEAHYKGSSLGKVFGRMILKNHSSGEYTHYISSDSFKPLDYNNPNISDLRKFKSTLSQKEWLDIVLETLGYDSSQLLFWEKIFTLIRLIPYCEKSYHIMELGKEKIEKSFLHDLFNDDISNLEVSMTLPELIKNKDHLTEENSIFLTSDIKNPEMKMEFKEGLFSDFNIDLENNPLFDSFCYLIPSWGMREIEEFRIKPNHKELPLDYFSKILKTLRHIELLNDITERISNMIPEASNEDINAISKTVSGFIKILHLGNMPSEEEFLAYLAIAMKPRYLLNQQIILTNKGNHKDKELSPERYILVLNSLNRFIAHIEDRPLYNDLHVIPNRMTSDCGEWITYHALDAIGFEKNRRVDPYQINPKDISKAKSCVSATNGISNIHNSRDSYFYAHLEILDIADYFIDYDTEFYDNLFGEKIIMSDPLQHNKSLSDKYIIYLDNSVGYPYKKPAPNQIECSCGEKASLIKNHYFYDKSSIQVPNKEVKKQLLKLGVI